MLQIQRASAGSGKTYTLARQYIRHLISITDPSTGRRRLRTADEIADAARHILAVTFTNKATREMKERIVERLADMAGREADSSEAVYLEGFMEELHAPEDQIRRAAATALSDILDNYSEFNVSTIDSFFQSVLRTFAYESDLNDSYQVEIDSELGIRVGVDTTLSSVNNPDEIGSDASFWIRELIGTAKDKRNRWNIFQKSLSSNSLYKSLVGIARKMESEEFKRISPCLDRYFEEHPHGLREAYLELKTRHDSLTARADAEIREAAGALRRFLDNATEMTLANISNLKYLDARIRKALDAPSEVDLCKMESYYEGKAYFRKSVKKADRMTPEELQPAADAIDRFYKSFGDKRRSIEEAGLAGWPLFRERFPFFGLMQSVRVKRADFFVANNVLCLSDTNTLLGRVIGDDDTPFIYERLGTRLDNFLIDEFQDTSLMQWNNFRPLLRESEARGGENLIIGDAKQSIYRFRNADPSLILEKVPAEFPDHEPHGHAPEENTNHRSFRRIVEFNNTLFSTIASLVDELREKESGGPGRRMSDVYSGVVQRLGERELEGYVEIRCRDASDFKNAAQAPDDAGEEGDDETSYPIAFGEIPGIINGIRSRGYTNLGDIGILVRTNAQGRQVVNALMDYNRRLEDGLDPIDFISEESLLISSSEAVKTAVATLRLIINGDYSPEERTEEGDKTPKTFMERMNMSCRFNYYAARNPDLGGAELIEGFFGDNDITESIHDLMTGLSTSALPAIVENIFLRFVSADIRRREAPFIAAFQDLVAEHCERYAADAASFIKWWDERGSSLSITSPEGVNAVSVMTIHKSKGLQFPFVIIPVMDFDVAPPRLSNEIIWVRPELPPTATPLPDVFPLEVNSRLASSVYAPAYRSLEEAAAMDSLNMAYVAFTRPEKELYVTLSVNTRKRQEGTIGSLTVSALRRMMKTGGGEGLLPPGAITCSGEESLPCFRIGTPTDKSLEQTVRKRRAACRAEKKRSGTRTPQRESPSGWPEIPSRIIEIDEYVVTDQCRYLHYKEEPLGALLSDDDADPRSEGNLFHALMERIGPASGLDKAILSMKTEGRLDDTMARKLTSLFARGMENPVIAGWFGPDVRVINERNILLPDGKTRRPDRIVVHEDGSATVIDYKFGAERPRSYERQVSRYRHDLLATGLFGRVDAYLWFVSQNEIVRVE